MSRLRCADYTQHLAGKTLKRVHWNNEEDWKCLTLEFTDQTLCSFRFELMVDEEAELSDFIGGNLSNERKIVPLPTSSKPTKPEGEWICQRTCYPQRGSRSILPLATTITKSKYMAGVQCLKRLYFLVHEPQIGRGKTAVDFALMEQGREVGKLAHQLFRGGVEVRTGDPEEAIRITRELVANPDVPAIFEATFENGGVLARVDVLQRRRDGKWRLVEVKSSASLKDEHLEDVAIQYRVLARCGLDVAACTLAHVDRNYVFQGGDIDARLFFKLRNLTRRVERLQTKLTFQLRSEFRVLAMLEAPDLPTGRHCTQPVTCEFFDQCNSPRPDNHIGYLPRIQASAVEELGEMGVESICDIPDDFQLNERQRRAATCVQTGKPWFSAELGEELSGLTYPLYFMDFETVNPAIPRFPGMRPYDQLPFQWSVHVQRRPSS